ncbi:MAG: EGF domain-containing protein [Sandaracinaceae bacterium]
MRPSATPSIAWAALSALAGLASACSGTLTVTPGDAAVGVDAGPECAPVVCGPNARCTAPGGIPRCVCDPGYDGLDPGCRDIDECARGLSTCDRFASCTNTVGSFECACLQGFTGDGETCVDIDECRENLDDCARGEPCTNFEGTYLCGCDVPGFRQVGDRCEDIDECAEGLDECGARATCANEAGGYACLCEPGFRGDGRSCADIDECAEALAGCGDGASCVNEPGTYRCACDPGYTGDGIVCEDVDECAEELAGCDERATCANEPGSFTCTCGDGLTGDGQTCEPVFDIVLAFFDDPTDAQRDAFEAAEARWEEVLYGDLSDVTNVAAQCGAPSGTARIDDLLIRVELLQIDGPGRILGQAGPICLRDQTGGAYLPFTGQMRFDTDDLEALERNGTLESVILHEMGHVLGIGPAWADLGLLRNPSCDGSGCTTRDTTYTGAEAMAAWQDLGGTGEPPVENRVGGGSSDRHWRENSDLRDELMSPIVSGSRGLSTVTLRSLVDLGYEVGPDRLADDFSLPAVLAGPPAEPFPLEDDLIEGPLWVLTRDGYRRVR